MRFFPVLTALAISGFLYLFILEREALMAFASGGAVAVTAAEDAAAEAAADADATETRRVRVVVQHAQKQPVETSVILRGRTEAARRVEVRAETSGLVVSEPLRRGAEIDAGDALCELSSGTRSAALAEARARLSEAEINFNAAKRLSEDGFASQTRLAAARAALEGAQAGVDAAVEEMARLVMHAPFDGILDADTAELGTLLQPGALCATVIKMDPIRLVGFVSESQVDRLEHGALAGGRLASGREVMGRVRFVARTADAATRTFRVEVEVENPDNAIREGQSAEMLIQAAGQEGHLLPGSALTLNDDGALGLRAIDDDDRVVFKPVTVLRDTTEGVWLAGLPDSVNAIVVGQEFVREGVQVHVTWRGEAPEGRE
ncbi:MAG: efflux RND transporter periplasmic adaptor subunit [Rhodobacteraceae bacterium]|nr:efflux RND transporter periplasmic adaptor subunit [Paracoccaceae bacterium]